MVKRGRFRGRHEDETEDEPTPVDEEITSPPAEPEEQAAPPPATGTGTSTGTTSLTVASVVGTIRLPSTISGTGVPAGTTVVSQKSGTPGGAGVYTTSANTTLAAVALTFTPSPTAVFFPDFVPILPPPLIGNPPPPAGTQNIPVVNGAVVGPAIAAAAAPPSTPGFVQPRFAPPPASATVPTAASLFPAFTIVQLSPPLTFNNVWTVPTLAGGVWTTHLPANVNNPAMPAIPVGSTWGPPGPSGSGPGPPVESNPPGAGKPFMAEAENENDEPRRGRRRA